MSVKEKISEILKKERKDNVFSVAADVLRAFVILHGSAWQSDLMDTLTGLWSLKELDLDAIIGGENLVPKALNRLSGLGLVESKKSLRADLSRREPIKEELHTVKNLGTLRRIFAADPLIEKYRREIMGYNSLRYHLSKPTDS